MYEYRAVVTRVVDGDTLDLDIDLGFKVHNWTRVRLANVDTPEVYGVKHSSPEYQAGLVASQKTREIAPVGSQCMVQTEKTGKYGRWIATLTVDGQATSLNQQLIDAGYA